MTVRPLHDRLIVKRVEEKETIKGGIIIPDSAKEKPQEGEVIAAGNGKKTEDGKVIPLGLVDGNPGQILNQGIGVLIAITLATVGTFVILKVCDVLIGVRVDHDAEELGLDLSQHGEEGYSLEA